MRKVVDWIRRKEVLYFLTISGCFFSIGLVIGGLGPIVLELAKRCKIDVETVGWFVSSRGIGYLAGNILGGWFVDMGAEVNVVLALSLTLCALSVCFVTISYIFPLALFLLLIQGITMGVLDSCGNLSLILVFRNENVAPYFQFLHFCFAIGSTVAPLIIGSVMDNFKNSFDLGYYVIAAIFIPFIFLLFIQESPKQEEEEPTTIGDGPIDENYRCGFSTFTFSLGDWFIVIITALFLCIPSEKMGFYVGAEVGTGSLIYTYVVKRGLGPDFTGYMMTFVFWGAIAFGRLAAIPISMYFSGMTMLLTNLLGSLASAICILIFKNEIIALWICIGTYGFFMASSFPTAFVVAEGMMKLTGSAVSIFVIGSGLGEVIVPLVISELFGTALSYMSLVYTMMASASIGLLCWVGLFLRARYAKKKEETNIFQSEDEGLQLDSQRATEESPLVG